MTRLYILCEGQTEETFVKNLLYSHLSRFGAYPIPIILKTKKSHSGTQYRGGVTSYEKIKREIFNLLKGRNVSCVTTLLDYYGLPDDFPGKSTLPKGNAYQYVSHLEYSFSTDIGDPRFIPYLMLHEFEAMLFVDISKIVEVLGQKNIQPDLGDLSSFVSPEEINNGSNTHPSARILRAFKGYSKTLHGPQVLSRIGLQTIRLKCPHFNEWLTNLEKCAILDSLGQ